MKSRSASSTDESVASANRTVEIGRFAPSPTGPLHLGSLLTAVASWMAARADGGRWLLRIEDLDESRCLPGAADSILRTLEQHGLAWDDLCYQHERLAFYHEALERLTQLGLTFPCTCSRSQLPEAGVYPGTCRDRSAISGEHALRLKVGDLSIEIDDSIQGKFAQHLGRDVGDFVIRRRDGIIAYQLAVVVDDAAQRITQVVRGADLLDNTPRQMLLFRLLGARPPRYSHVPVLADRTRHKLSKQTRATSVAGHSPNANLLLILDLLGHAPPPMLQGAQPREILDWGIAHWDISRIPRGVIHPEFVCI